MTYNLLKMILCLWFLWLIARTVNLCPEASSHWFLAYNYRPSLMFFVIPAFSLLGYRKICIVGREIMNLYPVSSISAGP